MFRALSDGFQAGPRNGQFMGVIFRHTPRRYNSLRGEDVTDELNYVDMISMENSVAAALKVTYEI